MDEGNKPSCSWQKGGILLCSGTYLKGTYHSPSGHLGGDQKVCDTWDDHQGNPDKCLSPHGEVSRARSELVALIVFLERSEPWVRFWTSELWPRSYLPAFLGCWIRMVGGGKRLRTPSTKIKGLYSSGTLLGPRTRNRNANSAGRKDRFRHLPRWECGALV